MSRGLVFFLVFFSPSRIRTVSDFLIKWLAFSAFTAKLEISTLLEICLVSRHFGFVNDFFKLRYSCKLVSFTLEYLAQFVSVVQCFT